MEGLGFTSNSKEKEDKQDAGQSNYDISELDQNESIVVPDNPGNGVLVDRGSDDFKASQVS